MMHTDRDANAEENWQRACDALMKSAPAGSIGKRGAALLNTSQPAVARCIADMDACGRGASADRSRTGCQLTKVWARVICRTRHRPYYDDRAQGLKKSDFLRIRRSV